MDGNIFVKLNYIAMKSTIFCSVIGTGLVSLLLAGCQSNQSPETNNRGAAAASQTSSVQYGGFPNQVVWGKHLVAMGGCGDCHTPTKMTPQGPVPDMTMYLAGHPAQVPPPQINRKEIESKGLIVTNDLTVWVGPWGITYSANITPDSTTGIGSWSEAQFINVFHNGKYQGLAGSRSLLPPMNFVAEGLSHAASDDELKAIFAYLQTIKPVHNQVPVFSPPVAAMEH